MVSYLSIRSAQSVVKVVRLVVHHAQRHEASTVGQKIRRNAEAPRRTRLRKPEHRRPAPVACLQPRRRRTLGRSSKMRPKLMAGGDRPRSGNSRPGGALWFRCCSLDIATSVTVSFVHDPVRWSDDGNASITAARISLGSRIVRAGNGASQH